MSNDLERALKAIASEVEEEASPEAEEIDFEFEDDPHGFRWFSDLASQACEAGRPAGFCAGCGAHHVREPGRMLCEECNITFRDIG